MKHRIHRAANVLVARGDPRDRLSRWRSEATSAGRLLLVDFELPQYWLPRNRPVSLTAIYHLRGEELRVAVTDQALTALELSADEQFECWLREHGLFAVTEGQPLPLVPRYIPKPWGREIWYTGVEQRGICGVGDAAASVPIPWLQAALPDCAAGESGRPLVLLKILEPSPEAVTGDLYFELHEEKREVYVVTGVDPTAWPDGIGYIRYGFDPDKVAAAPSAERFRRDYLAAVKAYEAVRRQLDESGGPAAAALLARERVLRTEMEAFTHMRPLEEGDVIAVPLRLPHSLQHGVRTVEFQTPVYERKILSFAQKVLTQAHWDTEAVVGEMLLTPPPEPRLECLQQLDGLSVERIVDFPDFEVRRARVDQGAGLELAALDDYALLMVVEGDLAVPGGRLGPEQALLLPRRWSGRLGPAAGTRQSVFLLALPRS